MAVLVATLVDTNSQHSFVRSLQIVCVSISIEVDVLLLMLVRSVNTVVPSGLCTNPERATAYEIRPNRYQDLPNVQRLNNG